MIAKITSIEQLKKVFVQILLSNTDKVSKISDDSVLGGVSYGISKVVQKALKDIALVETHLFPDFANGTNLDTIASRSGVPARLGASESSVYLRIIADVGTIYTQSVHLFMGQGIEFQLENDLTIGLEGYAYVRARSVQQGTRANVSSLLINKMSTEPTGHISVTNEFKAQGGRDIEDDEMFRHRIINYPNIMSRDTLSYLVQIMLKFNSNIFRVYRKGTTNDGRLILGIMLQNGSFLTTGELDTLSQQITPYLSLANISPTGRSLVQLENCSYLPVDISFRLESTSSADLTQLRIDLQNRVSKYLDLRFWDNRVVQWEYLLNVVSSHKDVVTLPESYFTPSADIIVYLGQYPRVRSFKMYDLDGILLSENTGSFEPVLYTDNIRYVE